MAHHRNEARCHATLAQIVNTHAETLHIAARQVDTPVTEIDCDILPEIGELEPAAHKTRKMLALGVAVAEKIEHQPPHRIGRVARVAEQIVERVEALKIDVATKGAEQIDEWLARDLVAAHSVGERDEDRMARRARIGEIELQFPLIQFRDAVFFVGKIVGHPRIGIDRVHVPAHLARHQPRRNREVFVMRAREPPAPCVCLFEAQYGIGGAGRGVVRGFILCCVRDFGIRPCRRGAHSASVFSAGFDAGHHAEADAGASPISSRAAARAHSSVSSKSSSVRAGAL